MSMIKPYKEGVCKICRKEGKRDKVPVINGLCHLSAPWHYQESQKAKYEAQKVKEHERQKKYAAKALAKQKEKVKPLPPVRIELNGEEYTLKGKLIEQGKKPTPIRKVSVKRAEQNRRYTILRKEYLEEYINCKANLEGCLGLADQIHHQKGRQGDLLLDVRYFLPVCAVCHDWITEFSGQAIERGLSISRLSKAS